MCYTDCCLFVSSLLFLGFYPGPESVILFLFIIHLESSWLGFELARFVFSSSLSL